MSKMVYIAGPVTGRPDRNRSAFEDAAMTVQLLTGLPSQRVKVPHSITSNYDSEAVAMQRCLNWICAQVEDGLYPLTVVVLPGWRDSLGTAVEVALARKLRVPVVELVDGALIELESVILCTDKQTNECPRCGNSGEHSNPGTSDKEGQRG